MRYYRPQTKFAKVMFLQVSVCPRGGGHAWQGTCVMWGVHGRGHAWQGGGVRGRRGVHGEGRDTFNERAVRILLECILVKCINLIETAIYFAAHFCRGNSIKSSVSLKDFAIDVFQHKYDKNAGLRTECGPS